LKSPEILSVSLASRRYTSEEIEATYVLNLSIWGDEEAESGGEINSKFKIKELLSHAPSFPIPNSQFLILND
jgi:hypothetical protein